MCSSCLGSKFICYRVNCSILDYRTIEETGANFVNAENHARVKWKIQRKTVISRLYIRLNTINMALKFN